MTVTSYLALYTTLLGWQQYQNLWGLVVGTGLIYLPFIGIILKSVVGPFTSMGAKPAAQIALRRLFLNVMVALLVIAFAAVPAVNLSPKILHYQPLCVPNAKVATPGNTGTTYDNAFNVPTGVKVPVLWYIVMAFSNGFTHAANIGLSCAPIDYRALHSQLALAKVQSPKLQKEISRFYTECYVPAYSKYMGGNFSDAGQGQINQILKEYGNQDLGWLGSRVLLNVSGFYDAIRANSPVAGFPYDSTRDAEEGQVTDHSKWGSPSCQVWWSDASNGLRAKLVKTLPVNLLQEIIHFGHKTPEMEDAAIRTLITHSSTQSLQDGVRGYESLNDDNPNGYASGFVGTILGDVGVAMHSFTFVPKLHLLINALPILQATLLFAVYVFLALAIPFSSYRMNFCIAGTFVIFSLIFCSFIWHLVAWFDHFLIQALYPHLFEVEAMGGVLGAQYNINMSFVNMVVGTLYLILPMAWMSVMSWAGFHFGGQITSMMKPMSSDADASGSSGGNIARGAVTSGIGKL